MKAIIYIITILALSSTALSGQSINKCDGNILLLTSEHVGQLTPKEIRDFLMTFGRECNGNIEFSEWSNELLFSVLAQQTELVLVVLEKEKYTVDQDEIIDDLSQPIANRIDIKNLISKIDKIKIDGEFKKRVINALMAGADAD
jgi:hypothetical protein